MGRSGPLGSLLLLTGLLFGLLGGWFGVISFVCGFFSAVVLSWEVYLDEMQDNDKL